MLFLKTAFKSGAIISAGFSLSEQRLLHENVLVALLQLLTAVTSPGKKGLMNGEETMAVQFSANFSAGCKIQEKHRRYLALLALCCNV